MKNIVVLAPHPDDETLGCGGTLLKHKSEGDSVSWIITTSMKKELGYTEERMFERDFEIKKVSDFYGFDRVIQLGFATTLLDEVPTGDIVGSVKKALDEIKPEVIYLPFPGDAHSDHKRVFGAGIACAKWFRLKSAKRVLVYETISETEFGIHPEERPFQPNVFVDISPFIEKKIKIMSFYKGEMGVPPFPRSAENIKALATFRGGMSGCLAAEAFMLLKEIA